MNRNRQRNPLPSPRNRATMAAICIGIVIALTGASHAQAELGGSYESVLDDQQAMHATLTTEDHPAYTAYILDMPDGTQVREYYSQHAGVFAIDWSGPGRLPDLNQVLGAYAARYAAAIQERHASPNTQHAGRTTPLRRSDPDFVMESRLVMRHFKGRAYIPQFVPQEVAIDEVR